MYKIAYFRQDGVFLFRMIGHNNNTIILDDVIAAVWDHWREDNECRKPEFLSLVKTSDDDAGDSIDKSRYRARPNGRVPPPPPPPKTIEREPSIPNAPPLKEDMLNNGHL